MKLVRCWTVLISMALGTACGSKQPNPSGPKVPGPDTAFGEAAVQCSAVRPQTDPDLMAWDPGSRGNLRDLSKQGVVAVRYEVNGCDVRLEVLSHCIGKGQYGYRSYVEQDSRVARNAQDLFTQVPLGAAGLQGKLRGGRVLRTDYVLVGLESLPAGRAYSRTELEGPDCARATHVISKVYVGGFGMAAGDSHSVEAAVSVFGFGGGGSGTQSIERVTSAGDPAACDEAKRTQNEHNNCAVPLRVGLMALDSPSAVCPEGAELVGDQCVRKQVITQVECPSGTRWNGKQCVGEIASAPPNTIQPIQPNVGAQTPDTQSAIRVSSVHCPSGMVAVSGGQFWMGADDGNQEERPAHRVTVRPFCIDKTETTVAQFSACVRAGACPPIPTTVEWSAYSAADTELWSRFCNGSRSDRQNHPVNCVDWNQATRYCAWAHKRLATEEEWEFAARGPSSRTYAWGNNPPGPTLLNGCGSECVALGKKLGRTWPSMFEGNDGFEATSPAGTYPGGVSPFGAFDMTGNVWEWTSSSYSDDYNSARTPERKVYRGGSWLNDAPIQVRGSARLWNVASFRHSLVGMRCAASVD